ncbi:rCG53398 [Rattus norvegicus]|uniref:RCG53398 n=1 Tax=Rattus norvegicus TaxID=10116 RepID=A6JRM6_RAT|nr:rCG53398 [Rattus norvegicus]
MRQEGRESQDLREARAQISVCTDRHGSVNKERGSEITSCTPCRPSSNSVHTETPVPGLQLHIILPIY